MTDHKFTNSDYLTAIMAADAACIATVNLPNDKHIRKLARELRDALNGYAAQIEGLPSAYDPKMPEAHAMLSLLARHAATHTFKLD
jgi:hypothetical protein